MPPLDPDVADLAPSVPALTAYELHAVTYLGMLDADAQVPTGAKLRGSCCTSIRTVNLERGGAFEIHLARAKWTKVGIPALAWPRLGSAARRLTDASSDQRQLDNFSYRGAQAPVCDMGGQPRRVCAACSRRGADIRPGWHIGRAF